MLKAHFKVEPHHHQELVAKGFPPELATQALGAGFDWKAIVQLIITYGLPIAIQIIQSLLSGNPTPVPTP